MNLKLFVFILFSFFSNSFLHAQNGWFSQSSGTTYELKSVSFVDANTGYAAGGTTSPPYYTDDVFLKTTDGGANWIVTPSGIFGDQDLFATCFWNANTGYVTARGIDQNPPFPNYVRILKTTDGGISFNPYIFPINFTELYYVFLTGSESGYITGEAGRVIKITNAGYFTKYVGYSNTLYSAYFLDTAAGFAVGSNGLIVKTTNGGNSWSSITSGTSNDLRSIFFANNVTGYIAGSYGTFLKTSNSGNNWFIQPTGNSYSYRSVFFTSIDTGYLSSTIVHRTTNGGLNWEAQTVPSSSYLNSMYFTGSDTGYVVGYGGVILKTVTGGMTNVKQVSNKIPKDYKLYQNYPNPFNPLTKIRFDLIKSAHTKIIIYNMLGKEMATLVNEKLNAGMYEIEWHASLEDASIYSSGIYFYILKADDYVDVKKMILVK